jgi:hypothetical protein
VAAFSLNNDARAYPLQILTWHEIVNDVVGGQPVAITFCPLCNTAISFNRVVNGETLRFGTTGLLRFSDLVMWDNKTESWWQQATGTAIVGSFTGTQLEFLSTEVVSFADFKAQFPEGKVLSRETGFSRAYGFNPYDYYDTTAPFLFSGTADPRLPELERVAGVNINGQAKAYPYSIIQQERVVNDVVGGRELVVFWKPGVASALDSPDISRGRDVGTATVYDRTVEGQLLTFRWDKGKFLDNETGSEWDIWGQAVAGPLQGKQLTKILNTTHFWFSWSTFNKGTEVYKR